MSSRQGSQDNPGKAVPAAPHEGPHRVAEFFAGAGLARLGLEAAGGFEVVWANDLDETKARLYRRRFGDEGRPEDHLHVGDVRSLTPGSLPANLDVAWASFPCTDVSLAGEREGLAGAESGTWWAFSDILVGDRKPRVIVAENVLGLATSHGGTDFARMLHGLADDGYILDALAIDARHFVPQSRPRLFVVAALDTGGVEEGQVSHPARPAWLWELLDAAGVKTFAPKLPPLPETTPGLDTAVERFPVGDRRWWDAERVAKFCAQLSPLHTRRLSSLVEQPHLSWRTAYRRTRNGKPAWEIREDSIAGCLRTARGGSSKQAVVEAGQGMLRIRWMSPREYAALMGCGDYPIDGFRDSQVYSGFGDAVVVPVVAWLARHHLRPVLDATR